MNTKFCEQYGVMANETTETSTSGSGEEISLSYSHVNFGDLVISMAYLVFSCQAP